MNNSLEDDKCNTISANESHIKAVEQKDDSESEGIEMDVQVEYNCLTDSKDESINMVNTVNKSDIVDWDNDINQEGTDNKETLMLENFIKCELREIKQEIDDDTLRHNTIDTEEYDYKEIKQELDTSVNVKNEIHGHDGVQLAGDSKSTEIQSEDKNGSKKWFLCQFCTYKTKEKSNWFRHMDSKHSERLGWYFYDSCVYKTKRKLKHTNRAHRIHQCTYCKYKTKYNKDLVSHMKRKHGTVIKTYQCQFCRARAKTTLTLRKHIFSKHKDKIKWYNCNFCNYKTLYESRLLIHISSKHYSNNVQCSVCEYRAENKSCLMQHVREHIEDAGTYQCELCEFKTMNKGSLTVHFRLKHLKAHNLSKHDAIAGWHKCHSCEYVTRIKSRLTFHVATVHPEDPKAFECSFCEAKFKQKWSLTKHIRRKHDETAEWYYCTFCDYKTKDKYYLQSHFKRGHKTEKCIDFIKTIKLEESKWI